MERLTVTATAQLIQMASFPIPFVDATSVVPRSHLRKEVLIMLLACSYKVLEGRAAWGALERSPPRGKKWIDI